MMNDDGSPAVMYDDGSPTAMNDDNGLFDRSLNRIGLHGIGRDGRGFSHAAHHAQSQRGGDDTVSEAFQHFVVIKNRHCAHS
jgi:hypothetical protein